jgi:hypothetical protein
MRRVPNCSLWLGTAADARRAETLFDAEIRAVVDLAWDEQPVAMPRGLCYLRIPLVDGPGNPTWMLRSAVTAIETLLRSGVVTLVCCGAGMSRCVCLAAGAVARIRGIPAAAALEAVAAAGPVDVSPGLWADVCACLAENAGPASPR